MFQAPAIAAAAPPISHISRRNGGGAGVGGVDNAFDSIIMDDHDFHSDDEDGGATGGKTRNKSRRELPTGAVATLKAWLLSPEHFTHPYPTPQDQIMLMQKTGIDKKQLKNWFTNARRRIWKPMLKKQLEQGKLAATAGGGVVMPGLMMAGIPGAAPMPGQDHHLQYQQQGVQIQEVSRRRRPNFLTGVASFRCMPYSLFSPIISCFRAKRSKSTSMETPSINNKPTCNPSLQRLVRRSITIPTTRAHPWQQLIPLWRPWHNLLRPFLVLLPPPRISNK